MTVTPVPDAAIAPHGLTPDTQGGGLIARLPKTPRALALLARFDRPIGWWLLFWPCLWGLALAGGLQRDWPLALWMLLGAVVMRGAGCVYNDIVDRDLDARVARTANRPLPAGLVSVRAAAIFAGALALVGLVVLLQLRPLAQAVALGSLGLVAAYPFMKRITWWPQAWLGLVFAWGALVGWLAVAQAPLAALACLYAGTVAWVIGYDTLYAVQDIEDDAMVGVRSSARALGKRVRSGVCVAYALALCGWGAAAWLVRPHVLTFVAFLPAALHLAWQVMRIPAPDDAAAGATALRLFRANRTTGALVAAAMIVVGTA